MNHSELSRFTHAELSNFTQEELAMIPADLLRKVLHDDRPVPPSVVERIKEICEQENNTRKAKGQPLIKMFPDNPKNAVQLTKLWAYLVMHAPELKAAIDSILSWLSI